MVGAHLRELALRHQIVSKVVKRSKDYLMASGELFLSTSLSAELAELWRAIAHSSTSF